jgi:hypothetical protein
MRFFETAVQSARYQVDDWPMAFVLYSNDEKKFCSLPASEREREREKWGLYY